MITNHQQAGAANKTLILIVSIVLLLLLTVVGGAAWAVSSGRLDLASVFEEPAPPPVEMSDKPLFKELEKFVVSLASDRTQRYMMLELSLVSHHPHMPEQADTLKSVIRNTLLKHFSGKSQDQVREELNTLDQLQTALQQELVAASKTYGHELAVEEVLVTNVVIQ